MRLKSIELSGFKSFAKKTKLEFDSTITAVVGPNGSGKSNIVEAFRFVLGEQSMKSMRGRRGEDLIWNGSASSPRAGRAAVALIFDNRDRAFDLDFDEVAIGRVVHRGGENDYILNGSTVRLRDIAGLLAQQNIGASGHHIISQGEADRILSAAPRERREMLEDALGLTSFLYKREEAEHKLEKAGEHVREVEALRRELSPHLKFLHTQVRKVEESHKLREELAAAYAEYLKHEEAYLNAAETALKEERHAPAAALQKLEARIAELRTQLDSKGKTDTLAHDLVELEARGRACAVRREAITRELGRIEGELAARNMLTEGDAPVPRATALRFGEQVVQELEAAAALPPEGLLQRITELLAAAREFVREIATGSSAALRSGNLEEKKEELERELEVVRADEARAAEAVGKLRATIEQKKDAGRDAERELFAAMAERSEVAGALRTLATREEMLAREREQFKQELAEAVALVGSRALEYQSHPASEEEERRKQEERRKKLERLKIRLEESGASGGEEVLKEYRETKERDDFLARELADLAAAREKLERLIAELTETLQTRFAEGIEKINTEFERFFTLMFGGGSAALSIVREKKLRRGLPPEEDEGDTEDDVEIEEGIDIAVSIPHKRIRGLHMLSGGERALTSIALIFAMSQVNPPPFLVLDETDAALDEANSRRYGDMIESLAKKSQLILITHNRETMSRAGVLYGVTMGSDGVSKLLSVKFEEAVAVAK